jgi:hypothetical protein
MDINRETTLSPIEMISYITGKHNTVLSSETYLDFLSFDLKKKRESMLEIFAMETYSITYISNMLAQIAPNATIIQSDDQRRTIQSIILDIGALPSAVFITCISANFPTAVCMALILNHARIPVILGGIHVSAAPDDVDVYIRDHSPYPDLISVVTGAGDSIVIKKIIGDLNKNQQKPQYRGTISIENGIWRPRQNVDVMPEMKIEALNRFPIIGNYFKKKFRVILTAPFAGCPYNCRFCSISALSMEKRRLVHRDPKDILDELDYFQPRSDHGSRLYFFMPDNLILGKEMFHAVLDGIVKKKLKVNFAAQISLDIASDDMLLKKMRNAGATHFFIGLESLDLRNLEYIGKHIANAIKKDNLTVNKYYCQQIRKIQNHGISIHVSFVFGLPFDYFQSFKTNTAVDVIRFCIENHVGIQSTSLTDLPGSQCFKESQQNGTYVYGQPGSMEYLLGLCLTDLTESNRQVPENLRNSRLITLYMTYEAARQIGKNSNAIRNANYMLPKAFAYPTFRGRKSVKERFIDAAVSAACQLYVALHKNVGDHLVHSISGIRGNFERLYDEETDEWVKSYFNQYLSKFF